MTTTRLETVRFEVTDAVARVILARPDVHNAFNAKMIDELHGVFEELGSTEGVRAVVLSGEGKSFCAGADLNWMRAIVDFSFDENLEESLRLFDLFHRIDTCPHPTVARVQGAAIGGGVGLVCACDIAVASERARFSLSEVKLGIVPACISPFVIRKIGEGRCRELFLTGERLDAERALGMGLVNRLVAPDDLDASVEELLALLLTSGPRAMAVAKELIARVPRMTFEEAREYTARCIAERRTSDEGQEGMNAFLEKRRPRFAEGGDA